MDSEAILKQLNCDYGVGYIRAFMKNKSPEYILKEYVQGNLNPCAAYRLLPFFYIKKMYDDIKQDGIYFYQNLISGDELTLLESIQINYLNKKLMNEYEAMRGNRGELKREKEGQQRKFDECVRLQGFIGEIEKKLTVANLKNYGIGIPKPSEGQLKVLKTKIPEYFDSEDMRLNYNFYFMYMKEYVNFLVIQHAYFIEWCDERLKELGDSTQQEDVDEIDDASTEPYDEDDEPDIDEPKVVVDQEKIAAGNKKKMILQKSFLDVKPFNFVTYLKYISGLMYVDNMVQSSRYTSKDIDAVMSRQIFGPNAVINVEEFLPYFYEVILGQQRTPAQINKYVAKYNTRYYDMMQKIYMKYVNDKYVPHKVWDDVVEEIQFIGGYT
jgi:hypothetical protein